VPGCATDALLVIVLALMNDVSMILVAYDNTVASKSPHIPKTGRIVLEAVLVSFVQSGLGLLFIFSFNHGGLSGFIWFLEPKSLFFIESKLLLLDINAINLLDSLCSRYLHRVDSYCSFY